MTQAGTYSNQVQVLQQLSHLFQHDLDDLDVILILDGNLGIHARACDPDGITNERRRMAMNVVT